MQSVAYALRACSVAVLGGGDLLLSASRLICVGVGAIPDVPAISSSSLLFALTAAVPALVAFLIWLYPCPMSAIALKKRNERKQHFRKKALP